MTPLPKAYQWLADEPGPRILKVALETYGTAEAAGAANAPTIMAWAKKVGLSKVYTADAIPWCGLWMHYVALQAGWPVDIVNPLGARNWARWGQAAGTPALGDVLVFWRGKISGWSGHVGMYVGEDREAFHVLGGNQSDRVSIKRLSKDRLLAARECPWRIARPPNVRQVFLSASSALSTNEA